MEEAEPEAEAPTAPQPKRPKKAQALKSVLVASGKVSTTTLLLIHGCGDAPGRPTPHTASWPALQP